MEMNWAQARVTGVRVIDSTNECLQFVLTELFLGARSCPDDAITCPKIEDVERFLERKFIREEALMAETSFPELAAHTSDHLRIIEKLRAMKQEVVCGTYDPAAMHELLTEWIVDHVSLFDAEFGRFLNARPSHTDDAN